MNWVIMPFLNNADQTGQAVEDVLTQTLPDVRLLLIDQGSIMEIRWSTAAAAHQFADCPRLHRWRHNPPLPSLAATWNRALQFVWESRGEYALVINNDVRLPPRTYELLREVQHLSGAWFVSAVNIGEAEWEKGVIKQELPDPRSKGGPD